MRKILGTLVLVLALCAPAFAGDIPNPPAPQPPPPSITTGAPTANGHIQNDDTDGLTETVLNLIESLLALF